MSKLKVTFYNDWRYLFSKDAIGGRLAAFTFFSLSFIKVDMPEVDGFHLTVLGIGLRVGPAGETPDA